MTAGDIGGPMSHQLATGSPDAGIAELVNRAPLEASGARDLILVADSLLTELPGWLPGWLPPR